MILLVYFLSLTDSRLLILKFGNETKDKMSPLFISISKAPPPVALKVEIASSAGFPFIGDAQITGSLGVSGSISITTGSLEGVVVDNVGDTFTSVPAIDHIVTLTQAEYDGLTPDDNTLYVISGSTVTNDAFPYSGSAQITGSLGVTGSIKGRAGY